PEALVNYLALIGWSPGKDDGGKDVEVLPVDELARRFSLDAVGHSAGVFDEEKLAWVNRHYLKMADPLRLARLAVPPFVEAGRARPRLSRLRDGDGERVGRSGEPGAGAAGVPVYVRSRRGAARARGP